MTKKYCSFEPVVLPYALLRPIDWDRQFTRPAPLDVEIGFGMGETLTRLAGEHPERNFIGIEQNWERIYKTLRALARVRDAEPGKFGNIRILKIDARVVFERLIAPITVDKVYCLFPCPWPKKGHAKHRLFTKGFLRLLNSRLKSKGELKIVTDYFPYYEWVLAQSKQTGFSVVTETVPPRYDTKFERKWTAEGQREFFQINFIKKRHVAVPVQEDHLLKSYTIKDFDPESFHPENMTGDRAVILKDMNYDRARQRVLLRVLVAEEHLTQHVWIAVTKKKTHWSIAGVEGQNIFPTLGVAQALDLIYHSAQRSVSDETNIKT